MNYYVVKSYPGSLMVLPAHYSLEAAINTVAYKEAGETGKSLFPESVVYAIETEEDLPLEQMANVLYTDDPKEAFAGALIGLARLSLRAYEKR